jgi:hypothetical protein
MATAFKKLLDDLGLDNIKLCKLCYEKTDDVGFYQCKLCTTVRKKSNGLSNLVSHIEFKHMDILKPFVVQQRSNSRGPINAYVRNLSKDAKQYHDWIEWIVMADLPFTFVEDKYTKKNLETIAKHTLLHYMELVTIINLIY